METTTVYRVVHPELGYGPWNINHHINFCELPDDERELIMTARNAMHEYYHSNIAYARKHRPVYDDFLNWKPSLVCGAPCLNTLRQWFNDADIINKLSDAGFTVMAYTMPSDTVKQSHSRMQVGIDMQHMISAEDCTILALID